MPNLELGPDDYKVRTKRGNWGRRDAGYMIPIAFFICGGIIAYVWWHRAEAALAIIFAFSIVMAVAFGMILGSWLKRFD